jgi:hypothetical protein
LTVLFPKWTNKLPAALAFGAAVLGLFVVFAVYYWFSPWYTDVGYAPAQPIQYSHAQHVGQFGMDCRYCHRMVESGPHASIPDNQTCMGCHAQVKKDSELLKPLFAAFDEDDGDPSRLPWVKVHLLPDYAYFDHSVHVHAGVGCASCHGRIDQMEVVQQVEPLSMGWCLECHRDPTPHLRPAGVSVTDMEWQPDAASIAAAEARLAVTAADPIPELNPPTHCSACHR